MVLDLEPSRPNQTKPTWPTYPTYFPDPPELPSHLTYPPTVTHLTYPPIFPTQQPDLSIHPEPTDNLHNPQITSGGSSLNPQITSINLQITLHSTDNTTSTKFHNLDKMLTKFHKFYQISQFQPNFRISTKFQNFDQTFRISTKFQNFNQISEFQPNFRIVMKKSPDLRFHICHCSISRFIHPPLLQCSMLPQCRNGQDWLLIACSFLQFIV